MVGGEVGHGDDLPLGLLREGLEHLVGNSVDRFADADETHLDGPLCAHVVRKGVDAGRDQARKEVAHGDPRGGSSGERAPDPLEHLGRRLTWGSSSPG